MSASAHTLVSKSRTSSRVKVTPVQKVLEMMNEMKVKAENLKEEEAKTFRKYAEWTDDRQRELGFEMESGNKQIEKLTAFIEQADNDVEKLGKEISSLEKDIGDMEAEMKEATDLRNEERQTFLETQEDLLESLEAIKEAEKVIKSGAQDQEQAAALLQRMATKIPKMPMVLAAFVQDDEVGAPKAAAFKSQSGGVLAMLKGLNKKFEKELNEVGTEESNKAHHYDLEMQHLGDTVKASKADLAEKKAEKGKTAAASAKAKGELQRTKDELEEDKKMLAEITSTFETKKNLFEGNQKTRTEEIAAIGKAIQIISSPEVSESHEEHVKSFGRSVSLLQTQSSQRRVAVRERVSKLLQRRAALLSSSTLRSFAEEVANSPFAKVIDLIKSLISRLKEEAAAEADHKQWCDEQLQSNQIARDTHGTKADRLKASLEQLTSDIAAMSKDISTLAAEQADFSKAMNKATALRQEEKAKNEDTVKDATAGAAATKQALEVLNKFYSSQSFLQQVPEMEKYSGQQGASTGVMGMLEVIESDFMRLKAETTADEQQAQKDYDGFMSEAAENKESKHKKEVQLKLDKDAAEFKKGNDAKDLELTQEKLDKANEYYDYLKPTCLEIHVSFEERAARRKEEIKALGEAYDILDEKSEE